VHKHFSSLIESNFEGISNSNLSRLLIFAGENLRQFLIRVLREASLNGVV
jgi:hypothetical protein